VTKVKPPCLPYLGMFLTDLNMVEEGNSNSLNDLINFEKRTRLAFVMKQILTFQKYSYQFLTEPRIHSFLTQIGALNDEALHHFSEICEPKNRTNRQAMSPVISKKKVESMFV